MLEGVHMHLPLGQALVQQTKVDGLQGSPGERQNGTRSSRGDGGRGDDGAARAVAAKARTMVRNCILVVEDEFGWWWV